MSQLTQLRRDLKKAANPKQAAILQRFFKTGQGQYGEGDVFLGIKVPRQREIASKYFGLSLAEIKKLLQSKIHEQRLVALLIMVAKFNQVTEAEKKRLFKFYLANSKWINNWDLVDLSAPSIVGQYLLKRPRQVLYRLAKSKNLWERRIAIVATYSFIRQNQFGDTLRIVTLLLGDQQDLIHKAAGWMLREVGKRDQVVLEKFLQKYASQMPRTTLRYAIERLPEKKRQRYLKLG